MTSGELRFDLHRRQSLAFQSEATEILYGGAAGGGKSYLQRVAAIDACVSVPGLQSYIFRRTHPELMDTHVVGPSGFLSMLGPWVQRGIAKINLSDMRIDFPQTRAAIHLCHCQHEKDVTKYQGAEIHFLLPDELTHFPASIYSYLRARVRLGGLKVPEEFAGKFPRILASSNPGGIGHNWVKAAFIDQHPPMEVWRAARSDGGMLRQFIPAKLEDNPTLTENDPGYADRLAGLGNPALIRAMLDGDWNIVAGGALDDVWSRDRHVVRPFDIPKSWKVDRSFDWGSSKPFSVGWWAESNGEDVEIGGEKRSFPKGTLFQIGELYGWNGKPNEGSRRIATEIARQIAADEKVLGIKDRCIPGPADSAIFAVENGASIAADMLKAGIQWTPAEKGPGSRKNGLERVRQYLKSGLSSPLESPGLFFFETCVHSIRTLPALPRDPKIADDVDTDSEDHAYDMVRYRVMNQRMSQGFR